MADWFVKDKRLSATPVDGRVPAAAKDAWQQCKRCETSFRVEEWADRQQVCAECDYHMYIAPAERVQHLLDPESMQEIHEGLRSVDVLSFVDVEAYAERITKAERKTKTDSAILTATGAIHGINVAVGAMDFRFLGGSLGSVVGEKIARLVETAISDALPVVIFASSGGARMQEGLFSLMQMSKTAAALARLRQAQLPYLSVLTHPTTGGTTASFASLGDVIVAEPGALIGFAGPRVIEQTIRQELPQGFQRSEFLLEKGFVDLICPRNGLRDLIHTLLKHLHGN